MAERSGENGRMHGGVAITVMGTIAAFVVGVVIGFLADMARADSKYVPLWLYSQDQQAIAKSLDKINDKLDRMNVNGGTN